VKFFVPGPVGKLEAWFERPEGEPRGAAVVGHPHPLHGGTMQNTVVFRTARALRSAGLATLRFNFRGVEASEGVHDGEGAEELDMSAGLDWLAQELPGKPLWAAGFSFGARTAIGLATREPRITGLIAVAPPVQVYDIPELNQLQQHGLILMGSRDEFGTLSDLERQYPNLPAGLETHEIEGADHLFRGKSPLVEATIENYASRILEPSL